MTDTVSATVISNLGVFLENFTPEHKDLESFVKYIENKFQYHLNVSIKINTTVQSIFRQDN